MIARFRLLSLTATFLISFPLLSKAQRLSPLATPPDWSQLEAYQGTITRPEFERLLLTVYAPAGAADGLISVEPDSALIKISLSPPKEFRLRFATDSASAKPIPRPWRSPRQLPPPLPNLPLSGLKIAIDPGHLGGPYAKMEERFFQLGQSRPVIEGEMTLLVARHLIPQLEAMGATVFNLRDGPLPTTKHRPESLRPLARSQLQERGIPDPRENYQPDNDPLRAQTVQAQSELLFYRIAEIHERAHLVNTQFHPDLVICLHFNAESWGDPLQPEFVPRNHLHLLVNGCYSAAELRFDDQRFAMLTKLLSQTFTEELPLATSLATSLADATQLPPYSYPNANAIRSSDNPFIWSRNLLANRLYNAPVAFLEPYVMNNEVLWMRVQAGDYDGTIFLAGLLRKSLYREYADAVATGLRNYYSNARAPLK